MTWLFFLNIGMGESFMWLKFLFTIIIMIIFCFIHKLFGNETETVTVGVKAGINLATINGEDAFLTIGDNLLDATTKISAVGGITAEFAFSEKFVMQSELLLSIKGVTFDASEYVQSWSLWYLELPLLFKSVFDMDNDVIGAIYAGPAVAYNVKSTYSIKQFNIENIEDETMKGENSINAFDFSAVIGCSFDMEALDSRLGLDLRYTYGLINIQKNMRRQNGAIGITVYYILTSLPI